MNELTCHNCGNDIIIVDCWGLLGEIIICQECKTEYELCIEETYENVYFYLQGGA